MRYALILTALLFLSSQAHATTFTFPNPYFLDVTYDLTIPSSTLSPYDVPAWHTSISDDLLTLIQPFSTDHFVFLYSAAVGLTPGDAFTVTWVRPFNEYGPNLSCMAPDAGRFACWYEITATGLVASVQDGVITGTGTSTANLPDDLIVKLTPSVDFVPIPEPSAFLLLAAGLPWLLGCGRTALRRR